MTKNNLNIIYKLKGKLPVHNAPEYVWDNIEQHFRLREQDNTDFAKIRNKLPVHEPDDLIWDNIERATTKESKRFHVNVSSRFMKIAATLLILTGLSVVLTLHFKIKDKIYYSSESASLSSAVLEEKPERNDDLSKIIKTMCNQESLFCNSDIYRELDTEIQDLDIEKNKIEKLYLNNKNQQLLKYLNTINNQKVELQKKIIQYSKNM